MPKMEHKISYFDFQPSVQSVELFNLWSCSICGACTRTEDLHLIKEINFKPFAYNDITVCQSSPMPGEGENVIKLKSPTNVHVQITT